MRYLQAEQAGDPLLPSIDRRNRVAVERYLANVIRTEEIGRNNIYLATVRKHGEVVETLGGKTVPAEIQGIKIGDCVLITAPMEILTEVGFRVKALSPFPRTYVASNANGYLHYSPPASYYGLGSYESMECLLAPEWEAMFYGAVEEIFKQLQAQS